ncbi:probable histone-lysine N-methyltransferase CG1716 [Drosophila biarmipes]|uniref:probable histone-lysine N-methyltransferase CG1716 n=1 Tax=Drosophila biarmipes TaxID=125945 RepID=UPI0007E85373|nr:probable histone-lysine N-methyltransferase CG1716 [Drosophila biarmipes]
MEESTPSHPAAVASRGRGRGRPPKIAAPSATPPPSQPPTEADASPTPPEDADGGQNECRRSSRKKIIKFDVRDLLNKNRKAHKIQIEARIDSNPSLGSSGPLRASASASASTSAAAASAASPAAVSVSRLFSMFESSQQALPPPPPPPALEIFAKPRPTQSLIVAQVTSEPATSGAVQTLASLPVAAARKRGRPRKSQPPVAATPVAVGPSCSDSDTNSTTSTTTSTTSSSGDSGEAAGIPKRKPKSKLRVSLKRLNLSRRPESFDSGNSPSSSSPEVEPPALQDENALDEQPEQEQTLSRIVIGDNSDSDSQIIFIEIETESPKAEEKEEEDSPAEGQPRALLDMDIELAKDGPTPDPEQDLDEIMVEVLSGPPSLWSADDEAEEEDPATERTTPPQEEPEAESTSPAPRRSRRSAQARRSSRQGKTLEETFAEIAAESSKQILEAEDSQDQEEHVLIDLIDDSLSQPEPVASQSPTIEHMEVAEVVSATESPQGKVVSPTLEEFVVEVIRQTPDPKPPKPKKVVPESEKVDPKLKEDVPEPEEETEIVPEAEVLIKAVPKLASEGVPKREMVTKAVPEAEPITETKSTAAVDAQPVEKLGRKSIAEPKPPTEVVSAEKEPTIEMKKEPEPKEEAHRKQAGKEIPEPEGSEPSKPMEAIPESVWIPQTEVDTKESQMETPEHNAENKEIREVRAVQPTLPAVRKSKDEGRHTESPTEATALKTEPARDDKAGAVPAEAKTRSGAGRPKSPPDTRGSRQEQDEKKSAVPGKKQPKVESELKKTAVLEKREHKKSLPETAPKKEKEAEKSLPEEVPAKSPPAAVAKRETARNPSPVELEKSSLEKDKDSDKSSETTLERQKDAARSSTEAATEKEVDVKESSPEMNPAKQKDAAKCQKETAPRKEIEKEKSALTASSVAMEELDDSTTDLTPRKEAIKLPPEGASLEKETTKPIPESVTSEISKSTQDHAATAEAAVSSAEAPKEDQAAKKLLPEHFTPSSGKSKEKFSPGFVECDAMFKAMDKANAQMRLEEKSKKKQKKVPAKVDLPTPNASTPALGQKKPLGGKTSARRNTIYEASPKQDRNSSPSSDSTQVITPVGKLKRSKAKKKLSARRSTICDEAKALRAGSPPMEELAASSPVSTSSDSSSKRNRPKTASPELGSGAKLDLRRNTICEDRQAETATPVPLTKRRFSMHPKASANPLHDTLLRLSAKKRGRKAGKGSMSRQNSLDSSSSASQGAPKKKIQKTADSLHAALVETESSESTSSGSKMRRWDVQASPELEAPNPLRDIAKFIEDGVNLLKRDYKNEEDQREEGQEDVKRDPDPEEDEFAQRVANIETPATTPSPSPTQSNPEDPASNTNLSQESSSGGVRRSHRIKQKPQGPRASQGRGVASMALAPISMDEQLAELANIEAINEQFLRSEGLNTFQPLRENYYRCARQVSQENAEMQCDCFLTGDEEAQGHLSCGAGCINRMLMIECGPLCTNGQRCTNKRFQQHQCWPCRVFRTEKKGCGITAELQIPPGEFIMEYVGEVIDSEEFERRQHLYSKDRKRHYYFMALRGEAIIDATSKGNISRYINHSCDPNAETQKWTVNGELRIGFFSVKPIQAGEEITFDYQYQRYGRDAQRCYCEAANCRGWIGGEPDSDEGEQLDVSSDSEVEEDEELEPEPGAEEEQGLPRKLPKAKAKSKVKVKLPLATNRKRKEQPKPKDREYKAGRWLKPTAGGSSGSGEKASRKPKVSKFHAMLEDPDVLEELSLLSRSGLKNQLDTLRFSRCMVRAKLLQTRLQLLGVLTRGELPCRRLFLDYHGLRLLHAWISENGNDNQLRMALLDTLESLPIPNRTMLKDSRVYQSVELWSTSLEQRQPTAEDGDQAQTQAALHKRMVALLEKWQALPEIFRIPKRERIEQMKEHEREADRQQKHVHASTALEDQRERESSNDRFRQDRFRRDTTSSRNGKPIRMSGNNTICTITTQPKGSNGSLDGMARNDSRRRPDAGFSSEPRRTLSKEQRRSLFERKVALDEAEKRVCSEDWREHELRCEFFGADLNTDPKQLPYYQNADTGEWFNNEDMPVPTPQRTELLSQALLSPEMDSGQAAPPAVEYKLPAGVDPLPPAWHWRMTSDGDIYYYNLRERISQWEPPSPEQRLQTLVEEDSTQQPLHELQIDPALLATELIQVDMDYVGSLSSKSLAQYVEAKVRERRELRRSRLVSIRVISPRRDEDRLYNQLESRKYKENKEKIRRRKEFFRRRKIDVPATDTASLPNSSDNPEEASATNSLPIQAYLYSSDEDATEAPDVEQPVAEGAVAQAEELDSLNLAPSTSHAALAALGKSPGQAVQASGVGGKRKLPMPPSVKKHRQEHRSKKSKSSHSLLSTISGREAHEKFRFEISGHVADFLRPYRKESCQLGRITSDEDYKFLIKRLSHHITTKELRYCDVTGNPLSCTESVKHKSYDFINQYMRKKGRVYRKPAESTIF